MAGFTTSYKYIASSPPSAWIVLRADATSWTYITRIIAPTAKDALEKYANGPHAKDGAYAVVPGSTWRKFKMRRTNVSIEEIK